MTLYRKYRPQTFGQVLGQPQVTGVISRAVAAGQPAHAYLFAGPRGTGKTSVARILAKSLNCLNRAENSAEPCNDCDHCRAIDKGAFLDVLELDAASNRGIDEIRQLKEQVAVSPTMGAYKVYILDEAHMLTDAAFNALLKTLEEPPAKVVFILCTTEAHKIPITIASRCQRLTFTRATLAQLTEALQVVVKAEKVAIEPAALELLAKLADGGYRDAEMLLEQVMAMDISDGKAKITVAELEKQLGLANQQVVDQLWQDLADQQLGSFVMHVEAFAASSGNVRQLTDALLDQSRLLMLISVDVGLGQDAGAEAQQQLKQFAGSLGQSTILLITQALLDSRQKLQHYQGHHQSLALETAILQALQPKSDNTSAKPVEKPATTTTPLSTTTASKPANPPVEVGSRATPTLSVDSAPTQAVQPDPGLEVAVSPSMPEVSQPIGPPADLTAMWSQALEAIRPHSRSLEALLRDSLPVSFDGTILVLQFWYVFHKNKLDSAKNRKMVEDAVSQIVGQPVTIQTELGDKAAKPVKKPMTKEDLHNVATVEEENLLDAAVDIFGGEIVE
jgi:DNA polymerase-3 subunit gamma/tau